MPKLEINEIFTSINGEVSPCNQGSIATFIRFSKCSLQCPWCDTKHHEKVNHSFWPDDDGILKKINGGPLAKNITITGGEPLQAFERNRDNFRAFLSYLCRDGHNIAIETNGIHHLSSELRPFIKGFVVDYKFFLLDKGWSVDKAFAAGKDLRSSDYVKLVIDKAHHIGLAKQFLSYYRSFTDPECSPTFAVSIVNEGGNHYLNPAEVIKSFADDGYDVLLNVQIHKFLKVP